MTHQSATICSLLLTFAQFFSKSRGNLTGSHRFLSANEKQAQTSHLLFEDLYHRTKDQSLLNVGISRGIECRIRRY